VEAPANAIKVRVQPRNVCGGPGLRRAERGPIAHPLTLNRL